MEEQEGYARGTPFARDWTKGGIFRNLLTLSWPMVIAEGTYMVSQTVDMIWVGKLGSASIAGVGVAGIVIMVVMSAKMGLIVGVRAMVARFVGTGDAKRANHVAQQALVISATYGVVMTVIGLFFAEPILSLFGLEADVVAEGAAYMRIFFAGWMPMSFWMMVYSIMQASGDTVTPMRITLFVRSIHMLLAPFLIFGWWVFPSLGVSGAALANVAAQSVGTAISFWVLLNGRTRLRLTLRDFCLDLNIIWRIVKIGLPACVMGVQMSLSNLVLAWFMVPFGTFAVAAHSLVERVQMILFLPNWAIASGAGILVGQNLGARQPGRAERSAWLATGIVQVVMVIGAVAILLWAEGIISIFNTETGLVEIASAFLRIAAANYLVIGLVLVLQQAIAGAGDTLPPMVLSLVMVWAVQIPLALLLPRVTDLGVYGVRWALVAGVVMGAVTYTTYFRLGRWKRKRV